MLKWVRFSVSTFASVYMCVTNILFVRDFFKL